MIIDQNKQKLVNAILYFCSQTEKCGITKLYKLLYFLDFEHFKAIGRNVTGLKYYAFEQGPFPSKLDRDMSKNKEYLEEAINLNTIQLNQGKVFKRVEPKKDVNLGVFSKRELRIMDKLIEDFKTSDSQEMVEATHLETLPWHNVFNSTPRGTLIPYELGVNEEDKEFINHIATENLEILHNYS